MNKQDCIKKACQVLRRNVRFDGAHLTLPTSEFAKDDTAIIRETTRLYVESWIVPLLDCIESGDVSLIKKYYLNQPGHEMKTEA